MRAKVFTSFSIDNFYEEQSFQDFLLHLYFPFQRVYKGKF